jgi:hypothetical protein
MFITVVPSVSSASGSKQTGYPEARLDNILLKAGIPASELDDMVYDEKLFFIENSGENFVYKGSTTINYFENADGELQEVPEPTGDISIMTIPSTDLTVQFQEVEVYVNGVRYKDIYPSFEWLTGTHYPKNDKLGVAVPAGWQIASGQNSCQTYRKFALNGSTWTVNDNGNCGGSPAVESTYGMQWENFDDPNIGQYNYRYKGTMFFRAKRASGTEVRMVGNYAQDKTSSGSLVYGVSINWGFVGFSISGGSGTSTDLDTKGFSRDVSW